MKFLYAPWRALYSKSHSVPSKQPNAAHTDCVFCIQHAQKNDAQHLIIKRFAHTYVMLNKYPYNAGHLLVLPIEHCGNLEQLSKETRAELMEVTSTSAEILKKTFGAQGLNIGLNVGEVAGGGIPSHLHMHVLPRFERDTNFMITIAKTPVISFDMHEIYEKLKAAFADVEL